MYFIQENHIFEEGSFFLFFLESLKCDTHCIYVIIFDAPLSTEYIYVSPSLHFFFFNEKKVRNVGPLSDRKKESGEAALANLTGPAGVGRRFTSGYLRER